MTRTVVFTGDIFRQQPRGGITRYVLELIARLTRPVELVLGAHQSIDPGLAEAGPRLAVALPPVRGIHRVTGPLGGLVDAWLVARRRGVILHPTYYRDPRGLPRREPLVVTVHDMTHERLAGAFPARGRRSDPARFKAALCARADRLACYSEATRRDLEEFLRVPADRVRVTPLASRDWSAIAAEPLAAPRPFLLWVGERHAYKNFLPTLAALARTPEANDLDLLCAGGGAWRPEERAAIASHGLAARVHQGDLSDGALRWAYEHAVGLLYPSLWEGFGLPILEAYALGCPVLTSDRASLPELAGDLGVVVAPDDPASLADGLARLVAADRGAPAREARRAHAGRWSWARCAAQHEQLYAELDG